MSSLSSPAGRGGGPIPFAAFHAELLGLYEPPLRAIRTRDRMRFVLRAVGELLGPDGTTAGLTPELVARFIRERPGSEAAITTHSLVAVLRAACNYAKVQGYATSSPFDFRGRWVPRYIEPKKRHHSLEEIRRVLDLLKSEVGACEGWARWRARRLHAAACTLAYTGMRAAEAIYLRVEDVILEDRMILILPRRERTLKTDAAAQPVPMPPPLAAVLADWMAHREGPLAGRPERAAACPHLFPNAGFTNAYANGRHGTKFVDQLKAAGLRAGVEGFTMHSLRHSFATHAESAWGLTEAAIRRILRHTSLSTQVHYRHADAENLRRLVVDVDFGGPDAKGGPA